MENAIDIAEADSYLCRAEKDKLNDEVVRLNQLIIDLQHLEDGKALDEAEIEKCRREKLELEAILSKAESNFKIANDKARNLANLISDLTDLSPTKEIEILERFENEKTSIYDVLKEVEEIKDKLPIIETKPDDLILVVEELGAVRDSLVERTGVDIDEIDLDEERAGTKVLVEVEKHHFEDAKSDLIAMLSAATDPDEIERLEEDLKSLHIDSSEKIAELYGALAEKEAAKSGLLLVDSLMDQVTNMIANENNYLLRDGSEVLFATPMLNRAVKDLAQDYLNIYNDRLAQLNDKVTSVELPEPDEGWLQGIFNGHEKQKLFEEYQDELSEYQDRVLTAFEPLTRPTPADGEEFHEWYGNEIGQAGNPTIYYFAASDDWLENGNVPEVRGSPYRDSYDFRTELERIMDINDAEANPEEFAERLVHATNLQVAKFWKEANALLDKNLDDISQDDRARMILHLAQIEVMKRHLDPFFDGVERKFEASIDKLKDSADEKYMSAGRPRRPLISVNLD